MMPFIKINTGLGTDIQKLGFEHTKFEAPVKYPIAGPHQSFNILATTQVRSGVEIENLEAFHIWSKRKFPE